MADIYMFRCPGCGYEARVAGGPTTTSMFAYGTIACRDCKELRDVAFGTRAVDGETGGPAGDGPGDSNDSVLEDLWAQYHGEFADARDSHRPVNVRLVEEIHAAIVAQQAMAKQSGFRKLDPRCPKSEEHAWESWRHPGPCPKCGETMEKGHLVTNRI